MILLFTTIFAQASTLNELKKNRKTSYLDFILLKIESRLIQRHVLLSSQPIVLRVQYQNIGTQVDFIENEHLLYIKLIYTFLLSHEQDSIQINIGQESYGRNG